MEPYEQEPIAVKPINIALLAEGIESAALELLEQAKVFMTEDVKQITFTAFSEQVGEWDIEITEDSIKILASEPSKDW